MGLNRINSFFLYSYFLKIGSGWVERKREIEIERKKERERERER